MTKLQNTLQERQKELKNLKQKQEEIEDKGTAQKVQMFLEKMSRNINNNPNYKVYRNEAKALIEADKTVHR